MHVAELMMNKHAMRVYSRHTHVQNYYITVSHRRIQDDINSGLALDRDTLLSSRCVPLTVLLNNDEEWGGHTWTMVIVRPSMNRNRTGRACICSLHMAHALGPPEIKGLFEEEGIKKIGKIRKTR